MSFFIYFYLFNNSSAVFAMKIAKEADVVKKTKTQRNVIVIINNKGT